MEEDERLFRIAEAIAPVFARMGWTWGEPAHIPDAAEIGATLIRLWDGCKKGSSISSGRLHVEWPEDDEEEGELVRIVLLDFRMDDITRNGTRWAVREEVKE